MNIIKAVKSAIAEEKFIYNTDYPEIKIKPDRLMPFDIMLSDGSRVMHNWNPTGEDFLSDKWELRD